MIQFFDTLFDTGDLQPLGATLGWRSDLVGLHAVSHALLALAYLIIPAAIGIVLWRRRDLARSARLVGVLFIVFIVTASMMHIAELVTLLYPHLRAPACSRC